MKKVDIILDYFNELFFDAKCALNFSSNYELLVAVILSAQCTDNRVNLVTKELFKIANTPQKMLKLGQDKLKQLIFSCGFYTSKSKAILESSADIINRFNGKVPENFFDLISLKGVGRKTANVVLAVAFNKETIAVDTHVLRVSKRLGLTSKNATPLTCEQDLNKLIKNNKAKFHHQTIWFGREICIAKKPKCDICKLKNICLYYKNDKK